MFFSSKSNPELISLHIPKTAGTSFRNILKSVYGDKEVVRFDITPKGITKLNELPYTKKGLPTVKVVHGHFVYETLKSIYQVPKECKMITWVRNPVDRVISNFYYLESKRNEIQNEDQGNILSMLKKNLIEYARADVNRNRQVKFLSGSKLEDFDFIGIFDHFNEEIIRLASVLKWKKAPEVLHHNQTPSKARTLSEDILDEIRELNKEDIFLFNEAVKLRSTKIS